MGKMEAVKETVLETVIWINVAPGTEQWRDFVNMAYQFRGPVIGGEFH
jgi:hypothetical protein